MFKRLMDSIRQLGTQLPQETFSFSLSEFEKEIEANPALKAEMIRLAEEMEKRNKELIPFEDLPY
jgi:hypothetical protein